MKLFKFTIVGVARSQPHGFVCALTADAARAAVQSALWSDESAATVTLARVPGVSVDRFEWGRSGVAYVNVRVKAYRVRVFVDEKGSPYILSTRVVRTDGLHTPREGRLTERAEATALEVAQAYFSAATAAAESV